MSTARNKTARNKTPRNNHPTHIAYQVQDREGQPGFWTRIGGAWAHADGQGFTLQLSAVPINGRVTLRIPSDKNQGK